ncbi:hypothetical protein F0562_036142 [Nyssa sinensis]|uniref:Uncharacterized protein n=1 Tax=Nyssa sinensis TaxID=561372 RepID=A0A5J5AH48_9ASTE|nr:hypothetical protein F0562_036142 [Nyssa sinensis]
MVVKDRSDVYYLRSDVYTRWDQVGMVDQGTEKEFGTKASDPSSPPSKISKAIALLASIALAAVATTATPTSLREAFTANLGTGDAATLAVVLTLDVVALAAFRPVNNGMATAAEIIIKDGDTKILLANASFFFFQLANGGLNQLIIYVIEKVILSKFFQWKE